MRRLTILAAFGLALSALAPATAFAQEEIESSDDPYVHQLANVGFPIDVGNFYRITVMQFDDIGADVAVGYDLDEDDDKVASVTIYVYPSYVADDQPDLPIAQRCSLEADQTRDAVMSADGRIGSKLIGRDVVTAPAAVMRGTATIDRFTFSDNFGGSIQPVTSESYVYCVPDSRWVVKVRSTWLGATDRRGQIATLVAAMRWPTRFPPTP